jgi:hypothetical protein
MAEQRDDEYPASYWRDRADEARARLEEMVTEDGRRWMREIARLYDKLSAAAAKREAEEKEPAARVSR